MARRPLKGCVSLIKPRMLAAIVALFLGSTAAAAPAGKLWSLLLSREYSLGLAAALCLVAGSNALNNYLDRDIDSLMGRTRRRALPSAMLSEVEALTFSLALIATSLTLIGFVASELLWAALLGLASYIALYTLIFKRRTGLNVVAATPAVAAPILAGWVVGRGFLDASGLAVAALSMTWGLAHFWSLTMIFREDYRRAGVPTLPGWLGVDRASKLIVSVSIATASLSYVPAILGDYGLLYVVGASALNTVLLALSLSLAFKPISGRRAWRLYKFTAPYILLLLLVAALDAHA